MGLRPTQGNENQVEEGLVGNYTYFVISTGAKRSGEICGFPHLAQRRARYGGTLDSWWFWIHTSNSARMGDHNRWRQDVLR